VFDYAPGITLVVINILFRIIFTNLIRPIEMYSEGTANTLLLLRYLYQEQFM